MDMEIRHFHLFAGLGGVHEVFLVQARVAADGNDVDVRVLQHLGHLEHRHLAGRNGHLFPRAGIPGHAFLAFLDLEGAEAANLDVFPVGESQFHRIEERIDHGVWGGCSERERRRILKQRRLDADVLV